MVLMGYNGGDMNKLRTTILAAMLLTVMPLQGFAEDKVAPMSTPKPYDLPYVGDMKTHITNYEDTLVKIARDNNLGFIELRSVNPDIDPWMPGDNTKLTLPTRHLLPDAPYEGIVINLPEMRLYAFQKDGSPPITHPIGVGRDGLSTPQGTTKVVRKMIGPSWRPTARMRAEKPELPAVVTPGPDNPLGTHALYLGWPEYLIHGTNRPFGIGRRVSSGCIRMYPEDIVTFYDEIDVNTEVRIVNQPIKAAWIDDVLYLEAHTSMDQADTMEQHGIVDTYEMTDGDMDILLKTAGKDAGALDWHKVREVIRERAGVPIAVAERGNT
ncbi:MAG TPA: L,D-transpeptidase [Micavibrio sp.]|nr:L,D-transpeptidase [Micavibrio sp.]HIL28158.1 L,D-transpeptidase [Micavibrio sp.]